MKAIVDKYLRSSAEDTPRLLAALAAGQLSGTADIVADYEAQLAAAFSSTYAIAVASGSAAIQTALHVMGDGAEVLVPATAPLPSIFPITAAGAVPVPVDIRPDCLDFDPADLRAKSRPGPARR
jgi:perosamine synthetase